MITTPTLDDFNRADENPLSGGGNWAGPVGGGTWIWADGLVPHQVRLQAIHARNQSVSNNAGSYWVAQFPAGDVEVWGVVEGNVGSSEDIGIFLHLTDPATTSIDGYLASFVDRGALTDGADLWRFDNGSTGTMLASNYDDHMPGSGDIILFRRVGNDLEIWLGEGGVWTNKITDTDSTYTGAGHAALYIGTDDASFVGFGGGAPIDVEFVPQVMRYL